MGGRKTKEGVSGRIEDKKENLTNLKRHVPVVLMQQQQQFITLLLLLLHPLLLSRRELRKEAFSCPKIEVKSDSKFNWSIAQYIYYSGEPLHVLLNGLFQEEDLPQGVPAHIFCRAKRSRTNKDLVFNQLMLALYTAEVSLKYSDFVISLSICCLGPKHGEITIHT